jgi:heme-degrading monooxygenase HmoA
MFARILTFELKAEKKEEFVKVMKNQVLPILKKQTGFLEILPFFPEQLKKEEKVCTISLWAARLDAERYERETYARVNEILKPFLTTPVELNHYTLETTLCENLVEALVA